jgi:DNA helicase-2/ATP-dependent DNA helicase PcrA
MSFSQGSISEGLNPEQARAVAAVRGPVCILAGAGSGKTTTITHRIANQVAVGAFEPSQILAVTFTEKAAGQMRSRLTGLGAGGVRTSTFHAAALAQLHALSQEVPGNVLASKALALRQIANSLPRPYRFRPAGDLATEVEWAKNRRIEPHAYLDCLGDHEPPIPADLMAHVFKRYEKGKVDRGLIDFEDLLARAVSMFEDDPHAVEAFQARYLAFTVDEYQDVNLLQQSLLSAWLGQRDDLCVVGDDYQSIYSFTGASARYLLEMPSRFERTQVIRLETNYRSTPEILDVANRLATQLGGTRKVLRSPARKGPDARLEPFADAGREMAAILRRISDLHSGGTSHERMAILYRANYRSEDYEEALSEAGVPYQVADSSFLGRPAARRMLRLLSRTNSTGLAEIVTRAAIKDGLIQGDLGGLGDQEVTRQNDLARLVRLAESFDDGEATTRDFVSDLEARFSPRGNGFGVHLLTYHRAKGLEFDAVFLPRLQEGELPFKRSKSDQAVAEERRLFYVGITRARRFLFVSWLAGGRNKPSRFLSEIGWAGPAEKSQETKRPKISSPAFDALKRWRLERAKAEEVPAYVVFHDRTLQEIAERSPGTVSELAEVPGVGPSKLERYGSDVLEVLTDSPSNN